MQRFNKVVAMLLCFVMLIGFLPVSVRAAEDDTVYVLAGGDFQEAGDHTGSAANITNILAQIGQKYDTMDGFLFMGDYDCETHGSAAETADGIAALMGAVQDSYSNLSHENSVLVQGNHDYKDANIDATGGHEFDGYSVFVMNEDDYPDGGGTETGVKALAEKLKTWLNNKLGEGYDAPIFVISHLPLAFSPRTNVVGDGKYAKLIFDVLNAAAGEGLNIIFMHGHNHAYGNDNYLGGEAIYLAKGDEINIAELGSTTKWTEETLNFTYMNAGYVGYYNDWDYVTTEGTDKLTMTVFAITGSEVTVERYSANGLYDLKSEGRNGRYVRSTEASADSLGLAYNTAVYTSPQTIMLGEAQDYGNIGSWVGVTAEPTDDVTTSGNDWTTITEPVPASTTYKYTQATSITAGEEYVIVGNSHAVALMDDDGDMGKQNVTISGSTMTSTTELTEWTFSGRTSGTIYNGNRYLYYKNNFSLKQDSSTTFTITDNGSDFRIQSGSYSFYYNGSSWARSSKSDAQYVRLYQLTDTITTGGTNGLYAYLDGELTYEVAPGTSAEDALAAVKDGIAIQYATAADYSDEQNFPDDGEGMTWTLDPSYDPTVPGDYAVTIAYNGVTLGTAEVVVPATTTYYIAEGNGLYIVDMNTTEANAMAAVKAGVTVSSATDANGTGKKAISDDEVTWKWVDKYNGADSGPYTVEILKDGTSLGTVEVKVDVKYETGIESDWTYIGESEGSGGSYTYTLDTNGIDTGSGNKYIIVARNQAYLLDAGSAVAVTLSSDGKTATTTTRDYEYYFTGSTSGLITRDGSNTLYQQNWGIHTGYIEDSNLDRFTNLNNGYYRIYDGDGTDRSLYYNGSSWTVTSENHTSSSYSVRLYKYTGTIGGTPGGPIYALIEGPTIYTVTQGSSATSALAKVKAGITGYTASDANGSDKTELADSDLTWKWKNTFNGNSTGSYWVEISYQGKVLGTVEVRVEPGVVNNYPEYPNEGAVKVSKTGTGIDFQSTGIAQIEVSASGVPIKKGADVIVMLDTSSSMVNNNVTGTNKTRAAVLEESLKNMISQFKTPGADGELLDIRVAIADFNGFYSSGAYARDGDDTMSDGISYSAPSEAQVYTGDRTLGAGAFIPVEDLANSYTLNYTSGTNYDYAFDAIYQMGTAIQEANGSDERDLYVIFMSDGAAMQWNYYHSMGTSSRWNNWITGAWTANQLDLNCTTHKYYYDEVDHNGDGMRNEHRMANAIKGDPSQTYEVIRKTDDLGTPTGETNMYMVPGLGAKLFSISFDATADNQVTEESMDKSIASLASEQTGTTKYYYKVTTAAELDNTFDAIGKDIAYAAYNARFVDQMGDDYNLQMKTATYSIVDGSTTTDKTLTPKIEIISYDIWTRQDYLNGDCSESRIGDRKGTYNVLETVTFSEDGTQAYSDQIGGGKQNILADGTQAGYAKGVIYAKTFLYNTNATGVAIDGVSIPTGRKADGTTTGSTNVLPSETFYWKMGTVQTSELAMRYYVYLTGSMEGTREGGSYPTNEYATLYYDNYLGNPCHKETVSPVMAWKEANVSYAFYLVNEAGEIIVNQTTGQTGSFANKIAVTNPVVYDTILLNNLDHVSSIEVASNERGILPVGYELYDDASVYTITINSNTTGAWEIEKGDDKVASTYVTQYKKDDASAYSNALTNNTIGDDYTHTVVWFAVLWKVQALPDTVVIDYGLSVDISVLANDMFGENGKLAGVGAYTDGLENTTAGSNLQNGFGTSYTGTYGSAKADNTTGKVRYTLNTMQMNGYEKFAYAVNYTGSENAGYYYDTVTVIPATTIYFEDNFNGGITYDTYTWGNGWEKVEDQSKSRWSVVGTAIDGTQDEDRPGYYSLTDANNVYGYDGVNNGMAAFSMGSSMKATVDYDNYASATFRFFGTGFDVISMTNDDTGFIYVDVYNVNEDGSRGTKVENYVVDTYYGFTKTSELYNVTYTFKNGSWVKSVGDVAAEGTVETAPVFPENPAAGVTVTGVEYLWVVTGDDGQSLYQVPVMEIEDLPYGHYEAVISASYDPVFDHHYDASASVAANSYDFYLDAIRIYDPANDGAVDSDTVIEDAYKADGEGWPSYVELRSVLLDAETLGNGDTDTKIEGIVFIDGSDAVRDAMISDYRSYGPNNEVYLAPGQRIAFLVDYPADNLSKMQIGIKSADGRDATYTITNVALTGVEEKYDAGDWFNVRNGKLDTTTDMYYDITGYEDHIIVISNTGNLYGTDGILSLTNIKFTYKEAPTADNGGEAGGAVDPTEATDAAPQTFSLKSSSAVSVNSASVLSTAAEQTTQTANGEASVYMTARAAALAAGAGVTEETVPEETVPEETVPEETVPEETEPEPTVPEETEPEVFEPKLFHVKLNKTSIKVGQNILVTVTTSADVDYVTVNGVRVTNCRNGSGGKRTWQMNVYGTEAGEMDVDVVCFNDADLASETQTLVVRVTRKGMFDWILDLF